MKKTIFILLMLLSLYGGAQTTSTIISAATAATSANFTYTPSNGRIGSIQIVTSASFNGTTGTLALQGSNDGTNWSTIYASDGVTALSFTLSSGNNTYVWEMLTVLYSQYRLVYTKGNASTGTISATILTR